MSIILVIVGAIYIAFYIRGLVWFSHYMFVIWKGIQHIRIKPKNEGLKTYPSWSYSNNIEIKSSILLNVIKGISNLLIAVFFHFPILLVKSLLALPVVGFGCMIVPKEIFKDKILNKIVTQVVDSANEKLICSKEQLSKLENYLYNNLTI